MPGLQLNDVPLAHAGKLVQYIKDPDSLEASLAQLTRDMKSASDEASRRMKKVQDLFRDIPQVAQDIQNIYKMGRTSGHTDMDSLISLMDGKHEECLKHTKYCTARFESVRKLIEEIHELCTIRERFFEDEIRGLKSKKESLNLKVSYKQTEMDALRKRVIEAKELNEARQNVGRTKSEKVDTVVEEVALSTFLGGASVAATIGAVVFPLLIPFAIASAAIAGVHSVKSGVNIAEASDAHKSAKSDLDYEERKHEQCKKELAELKSEMSQLQSDLNQVLKSNESLSSQKYTLGQRSSQVVQLRQNWGNMERFFQRVADRVSETDGITIKGFTDTARALSGKGMSALKTRALKNKAELVHQSIGRTGELLGTRSQQQQRMVCIGYNKFISWPPGPGQKSLKVYQLVPDDI